jgi:hypothetical protein
MQKTLLSWDSVVRGLFPLQTSTPKPTPQHLAAPTPTKQQTQLRAHGKSVPIVAAQRALTAHSPLAML